MSTYPSRFLVEFGPYGDVIFFAAIALCLILGIIFSIHHSIKTKNKWKKVLEESRETQRKKFQQTNNSP